MKILCLIIATVTYVAGFGLGFTIEGSASWLVIAGGIALGTILLGLWKVIGLLEKKNEIQ